MGKTDPNAKPKHEILKALAESVKWKRGDLIPFPNKLFAAELAGSTTSPTFQPHEVTDAPFSTDAPRLLQELLDDGLIETKTQIVELPPAYTPVNMLIGVALTAKGVSALTEGEKSFLDRGIDKQPMTLLQIVVMFVLPPACFFAGKAYESWVSPCPKAAQQQVEQPAPRAASAPSP